MKHFNALDLHDILCAQDVKRWTIIPMGRQQNLAEHTFNVVAISRAIARLLDMDDVNVMKYAFDHDLDEVIGGDIPTTAKEEFGIGICYGGKGKGKCTAKEIAIVKLADTIEASWYIDHYGIGPRAYEAGNNCLNRLVDLIKESPDDIKEIMAGEFTCQLRGHKHKEGKVQ